MASLIINNEETTSKNHLHHHLEKIALKDELLEVKKSVLPEQQQSSPKPTLSVTNAPLNEKMGMFDKLPGAEAGLTCMKMIVFELTYRNGSPDANESPSRRDQYLLRKRQRNQSNRTCAHSKGGTGGECGGRRLSSNSLARLRVQRCLHTHCLQACLALCLFGFPCVCSFAHENANV